MTELVLICHGKLAETLLETAEEIVGRIEGVSCLSNAGKSPEIVRAEVSESLARMDHPDGAIIMADLHGSSCWRTGLEELHLEKNIAFPIAVVAGINLGMLLSYFYKRDSLAFTELAEALVADGRRGISGPTFSTEADR